jgi:hypothetical protein
LCLVRRSKDALGKGVSSICVEHVKLGIDERGMTGTQKKPEREGEREEKYTVAYEEHRLKRKQENVLS